MNDRSDPMHISAAKPAPISKRGWKPTARLGSGQRFTSNVR